ncbi:hypothetical protein MCOR07_003157 [Pyricularia oryzae]|uniref:Uncharacterized protein n=2 Tax=Pyricularia TaxID=48558 RepID=A0ABQ8NMM8_PYRGI|nr:hypothetical protein MCOR33_005664 [Pyricularia grisea]KAI6321769.1 hypothetical protein MCOR30_007811 [Pyricularia oryzae]KAI6325953.1 hypothetical protein MCOR34_000962 [Pyricularia oryzae]KAI6394521.1 hypothetical protein MCOR23_007484 [Pyricularia oryzae]KAI6413790.1 hypothetical protein MCOR20_002583 [Pyricularia oryzae]
MASEICAYRGFALIVLVLLQCQRALASGCTQVYCQLAVCAPNADEAYNVASLGLVGIMGPDCAGWESNSPTNGGRGNCTEGLSTFSGGFYVWRAWSALGDDYSATFAQWGNFLGATCTGRKTVKCKGKSGEYPSPVTGRCQPKKGCQRHPWTTNA